MIEGHLVKVFECILVIMNTCIRWFIIPLPILEENISKEYGVVN